MIKEDYCSYEVAKLLDKKGFREYCDAIYVILENGDYCWSKIDVPIRDCSTCKPTAILCPTHQMAMKWLREVHGLNIFVIQDEENQNCFRAIIQSKLLINGRYGLNRETFEEAVEAAIKYSLENLI